MPKADNIVNMPGYRLVSASGHNPLLLKVKITLKPRCPHCRNTELRYKDKRLRLIKHVPFGGRRTFIEIESRKYCCKSCQRYFFQELPGIGKYQRATFKFKKHVSKLHRHGINQKCLAQELHIGSATVERWYHQCFQRDDANISNRHCPRVLGIDEHFFSKRKRFATTLCDLHKQRVFDLLPGRNKNEIHSDLHNLKGRLDVKVVCMDLSNNYRRIAKEYFPNALIVADRFHVIRLVNHAFMEAYKYFEPKIKSHRGLLAALRTNPENLNYARRKNRDKLFRECPSVKALYDFKVKLCHLLMYKKRTKRQCIGLAKTLFRILRELAQSPIKPLKRLAKTISSWREEIARMWRFTKNNGITEGFHRKMKLIQRNAYGFRNFENYRLRVRVLCS